MSRRFVQVPLLIFSKNRAGVGLKQLLFLINYILKIECFVSVIKLDEKL